MSYPFVYLLTLTVITSSLLVMVGADRIDFDKCRQAGFDPYQLSCGTCDLLPGRVLEQCQSCCLSYKTLEKRTQRYQAAVIAHPKSGMSYYPEIDSLVGEDWEELVSQKGDNRLIFKDTSREPRPSALFWFNEIPKSSLSTEELKEKADEMVLLQGWKRDDVREMLKAILPDQES